MECRVTVGRSSYQRFGIHLKVVGHQAPSHYILTSRVQWSHRAFPSPHELRPVSLFRWPQMDRQAAMGAFGNQDSSQAVLGMFFVRAGLWCPSHCHRKFQCQQWRQFLASVPGGTRYAHWPKFLPIDMAHHRYIFQASSSLPGLYSFIVTASVHLGRATTTVLL